MQICSKKGFKLMTGVMAASLLLGGCTSVEPSKTPESLTNDPSVKAEINFRDVEGADYNAAQMDQEYRRYCFDIFSQTIRDYGKDKNIMISPASIMMALDMVAAGAKGESLEQLTNLFAAGQGPLTQQAYAADLMDKINGSKDVEFSCANAVWANGKLLGNMVNKDYVDYIQDIFLSEYTVEDFDKKTVDNINSWIYEHTDHMIEQAVDDLDPATVMVLVNAIAFDAKWETGYEDYQIDQGEFRKVDGSTEEVTYLTDITSAYYQTDEATGFIKEYEGGQYGFLVILPEDASMSANEFAKNFTAEDYEKFINSVSYDYEVHSKMPEFSYDFDYTVNDTLKNLGCTDIFDAGSADLSGIAGQKGEIFVSKVIHKTHIEVDREGTKAAAVTIVSHNLAAEPAIVTPVKIVECDRPYVYAIVDMDTMAPIFVGTVNEI